MTKTLSVSAIHHGTVIDHISAGQAIRIVHMLHLLNKKHKVTIGLNLPSGRMGLKDIIKIENHVLANEDANDIMIFAPDATINVIRDFEVIDKIITKLPDTIAGPFICPNLACITHVEPVQTFFYIKSHGKQVYLKCKHCEKSYERNRVNVKELTC
jgi:aspartate carbamoyltransferase regulatory subunit